MKPDEDAAALDDVPLDPVVRSVLSSVRMSAHLPPNFYRERFRLQRWSFRYRETIREGIAALDSSAFERHGNASDFPIMSVPVSKIIWLISFVHSLFLYLIYNVVYRSVFLRKKKNTATTPFCVTFEFGFLKVYI